ncbi:hypothetical protein JZ751_013653 [Albula glossodonta]|uniref:Uncharacterized protein n=1 Tax=Albula glossodonta TaxID=121402 RepID=A0A8T2P4A7_9TELE|nr:hypothetical protein JZ751_013653 [Albula glossodonta]
MRDALTPAHTKCIVATAPVPKERFCACGWVEASARTEAVCYRSTNGAKVNGLCPTGMTADGFEFDNLGCSDSQARPLTREGVENISP